MFCTKCGSVLEDDAKFCTTCGEAVDGSGKKNIDKVEQNLSIAEKSIIAVLFAIILIGIGVITTLLIMGDNTAQDTIKENEPIKETIESTIAQSQSIDSKIEESKIWNEADSKVEEQTQTYNEPVGIELENNNAEYIFPTSNIEYLTMNDLMGLSQEECRIARNELYARYGRLFNDENLQAYFNSCSWYFGSISPEDFDNSILNEYEVANRDLIVQYEQEMGYR